MRLSLEGVFGKFEVLRIVLVRKIWILGERRKNGRLLLEIGFNDEGNFFGDHVISGIFRHLSHG